MKVVFKNFFRSDMVALTMESVRHFLPEAEFHVLNLYKFSKDEYPPIPVRGAFNYYRPTKYHSMGASVGNKLNNLFFSEGYNYIADIFKEKDEKVLMLCEDHFFTTGATLRELKEKDFDIAYAPWPSYGPGKSKQSDGANGSILCVRPKNVPFPIPEIRDSVEHILYAFVEQVPENRRYALTTRDAIDYKGDGFYSNSAEEIREALTKANIL